jgi:hypothetical protein
MSGDLFGDQEWVGMPEFVQEKKEPYKTLIVRFSTEKDYEDFQEKIGQKLTVKTKSIWHPKIIRGENAHLRWFDES